MPAPGTTLADLIAETVLAHPGVVSLHGGAHGLLRSHLPGRTVLGVRGGGTEPVEVGVVLRLVAPLPSVVAELRAAVRSVAGDVPVDITVADVLAPGEPDAAEADGDP
ncbi:hypothetical protein JOF53_002299 [Crossiella equi]|uniref:Asp23/Gls24 family envelope stress response protein n=1 Tax=Crossiella equi TaxID=130796 RepID=A0ABS5AAV7_9PSEU|nr:hypothetical protein [Crossiella equi]MBP2473427.1 hypothetical protein [Crossiella equi]